MEYLFGFVFTLLKIAIQASFYAALACGLAWLTNTLPANNARLWASRQGWRLWQRSFVVAYAALFLFSCTYWGDHGLGDSARIPLGHGEEMQQINGTDAYFEGSMPFTVSDMAGSQQVDKFQVADEILCAQAERPFYFTYNLVTKEHHVFTDSLTYSAYATPRGLPPSSELQSFWKQYNHYWGGWRFWLLA